MIEVFKQMIKAMENTTRLDFGSDSYRQFNAAIQSGKQAIAELESQEPDVEETLHLYAFNYRQAHTSQAHEMWLKLEQFVDRKMKAPQRTEQEPVAWIALQKEAQQIVESKVLWKKFIDGTPLANDIACWMADFALQHTTPPQRTERNFCSRCGKRTADLTTIHTCTPPQD
jgi:hypothetical protein